jgi:hypothetical protein
MTTRELVNPSNGEITSLTDWELLKDQAQMLVKSGFLPPALNTPEKVMAVALKGKELGIPMMEAISKIDIIQGKPAIAPQLMLALAIRTHEVEFHTIESDDTKAVFTIKRKGYPQAHVAEFGVKEATELGLMTKDNYRKQKRTMFEWRAIAKGLRIVFPDAISGLYTPEELGAKVNVHEDGSIDIQPERPAIQAPRSRQESAALGSGALARDSDRSGNGVVHTEGPGSAAEISPAEPEIPFPSESAAIEKLPKDYKRLKAIAREKGIEPEKMKAAMKMLFSKSSSKELDDAECLQLIEMVNDGRIRNA